MYELAYITGGGFYQVRKNSFPSYIQPKQSFRSTIGRMPKASGLLSWRTDSIRTIFRAVEVCKLFVSGAQISPFREIFSLNDPLLVAFEGEIFTIRKYFTP